MDWHALQDRAEAAIKAVARSNVRYADIRLERLDSTTIRFHGRRLEMAGRNFDAGGLARVLLDKGGWGVASFNSFDDLEQRLALARDCAGVQSAGPPLEFADVPAVRDRVVDPVRRDFRDVPLADKVERMRAYNNLLLGHDQRIVDTQVGYTDRQVEKLLVTSGGSAVFQATPFCQVMLMAIARQSGGDNIQRAFESHGDTASGYELADGLEPQAAEVAGRAVELLSAEKVKSGRYPVVLDPKLAGVFIHEAFGHLSEADHVCENLRAREMMELGRRFGPDYFNVHDDGTIGGLWGSHRYDDEGVPTRAAPLIVRGRLAGRLHSRYTAAVMREPVTGNAYAVDYQHAPIVRMTNTYIAPGESKLADLIGPIKEGVYAAGMFGGQTMLENFSFSAGYGRMIRDGKLAELVRDVTLSGNLFATLDSVSGLGDDLRWFGGGGCGKGGQSPLPVGLGSPHLRIDNVLIGGQ